MREKHVGNRDRRFVPGEFATTEGDRFCLTPPEDVREGDVLRVQYRTAAEGRISPTASSRCSDTTPTSSPRCPFVPLVGALLPLPAIR